jgi:hypothetical protein
MYDEPESGQRDGRQIPSPPRAQIATGTAAARSTAHRGPGVMAACSPALALGKLQIDQSCLASASRKRSEIPVLTTRPPMWPAVCLLPPETRLTSWSVGKCSALPRPFKARCA